MSSSSSVAATSAAAPPGAATWNVAVPPAASASSAAASVTAFHRFQVAGVKTSVAPPFTARSPSPPATFATVTVVENAGARSSATKNRPSPFSRTFTAARFTTGTAGTPACVTVQVRAHPPPDTVIAPVRATVPSFADTPKITTPFPLPAAPEAIASHGSGDDAVHGTLAVTSISRRIEASAGTLVLAGRIAREGGAIPAPDASSAETPPVWSELTATVPP